MESVCRYIDADHSYWLDGQRVPSITQMLEQVGLVDATWFTAESRDRGTMIHDLCSAYDYGTLHDPEEVTEEYRGWVKAYVKAKSMVRFEILAIEEALAHPHYRYAGRIDRRLIIYSAQGLMELKSGVKEKAHAIQTALQAMLAELECGIPAEMLSRYALYLRGNGKFTLEQHKDSRDFIEAKNVIRTCCS